MAVAPPWPSPSPCLIPTFAPFTAATPAVAARLRFRRRLLRHPHEPRAQRRAILAHHGSHGGGGDGHPGAVAVASSSSSS